ncbi:MAG: hypothetical protein IJX74_02075 [Clostridia bacterium]|nr:hypothetical protein [Clostridia bacterium]
MVKNCSSVGRVILFSTMYGVWFSLFSFSALNALAHLIWFSTVSDPRFFLFCIVMTVLAAAALVATLIFNIIYFPKEDKVWLTVGAEIGIAFLTSLYMYYAWACLFELLF